MRKSSTPTPSQSTSASAAILGKKADVTLDNLLSAWKPEFLALFSSCGLSAPASSSTLSVLHLAFLRSYGIDSSCALEVFVNTTTARQLQQIAKESTAALASQTCTTTCQDRQTLLQMRYLQRSENTNSRSQSWNGAPGNFTR